jgi:serine/threonine protein kinase
MIRNYVIHHYIGRGSYGKVFCVSDTGNTNTDVILNANIPKYYAMKEVPLLELSVKEKMQLLTEVCLQKCSTSPYIVSYYDSFIENENLYILSEYASFGDLQRYIGIASSLTDEFIAKVLIQSAMGLAYLHKHNIVHRDIKLNNILVSDDTSIRIADLGISRFFPEANLLNSVTGSPLYMSPEMCIGTGYNEKTDVWSLGCVIYYLLKGTYPYNGSNMFQLYYDIMDKLYEPIGAESTARYDEWNRILGKLLDKNPFTRYRASVICQDPFLLGLADMTLDEIQKQVHSTNTIGENIWELYNRTIATRMEPDEEITDEQFIGMVQMITDYTPKKTMRSIMSIPSVPSVPSIPINLAGMQPHPPSSSPHITPRSVRSRSSTQRTPMPPSPTLSSTPSSNSPRVSIFSLSSTPPSSNSGLNNSPRVSFCSYSHSIGQIPTPLKRQSSFLPPIERK